MNFMFLSTQLAFQIITLYVPIAIFALFFLAAILAYIWKPLWFLKTLWWGIGVFASLYLAKSFYLVWLQYVTWQADAFSQFLLPPHQPITYFWQYVWTHFLIPLPWTLGGAVAMGGIILVLGALSRGRMIDPHDALLAIFGSLIVGWPDMLGYILVTLVLALLWAVVYGIIKQQSRTLILITPFFFVSLLIVFWGGEYITRFIGLGQLSV